ncbi:putative immune-type receptor 6a precursor [Silurus asotus]|uniref:T-cell surface glycoprotein CD8 alpha chain n=1 Tax=Silurus asotus TaxID=30991 RepID=A0AAD5AXZ6_SILAS|nr:putative immune-type receptor 6a precursor [Silurus asotus]
MISLFVALYSLLCLCTAVKTSDIKELQEKTVKSGQDLTIVECNISLIRDKSKVVWYRQSFGKMPQFFAKRYGINSYTFAGGFNDNRFSFTVNEHQFDLIIKNLREDDEGEYFCGEMEGATIKFTSGARLQFEGASSRKPEISSNQADVALNYAAVNFAKKPSSSRKSRNMKK